VTSEHASAAEDRAVGIGLIVAGALAVALLAGGGAYAALRHEPSRLDLVVRCLGQERGLPVKGDPYWDPIALSANAGSVAAEIETNPVTISLAGSADEATSLLARYRASNVPAGRLTERGRLVAVWGWPPSPTQLQTLYDCTY